MMLAVNDNDTSMEFDLKEVLHQIGKAGILKNVLSNENISLSGNTKIQLKQNSVSIYKIGY